MPVSCFNSVMDIKDMANEVAELIPEDHPDGVFFATPVVGLFAIRHYEPSPVTATVYNPVAALVLQGEKIATVGVSQRETVLSAGDCVVVSHTVPAYNRVSIASKSAPYFILVTELDLTQIRSLQSRIETVSDTGVSGALDSGRSSSEIVDAFGRMLRLKDDQIEQTILLETVKMELNFRLLQSQQGGVLRELLDNNSIASRVSLAIEIIRNDIAVENSVDVLSKAAGMGKSTFFANFRKVTGSTPSQYLKDLRLMEAKSLLNTSRERVSEVARQVGYHTLSHFSKDYKDKFGLAPSEERKSISND